MFHFPDRSGVAQSACLPLALAVVIAAGLLVALFAIAALLAAIGVEWLFGSRWLVPARRTVAALVIGTFLALFRWLTGSVVSAVIGSAVSLAPVLIATLLAVRFTALLLAGFLA